MFSFYPVPELGDRLMPDAPEPEIDFAPGDDVIAHGKNGMDYDGFVKAVDAWQGLALVRIWDHEVRSFHVAWWEVKHLSNKKAVAA
jgi:hypothetical protein